MTPMSHILTSKPYFVNRGQYNALPIIKKPRVRMSAGLLIS